MNSSRNDWLRPGLTSAKLWRRVLRHCFVSIPVLAGLISGLTSVFSPSVSAATYYVNASNPAPVAPYTDWSTAATNIQDAVDAAASGDLVLVTNGVYQYGGRVVSAATTNRVAVTQSIILKSVNGPGVTSIVGYQLPQYDIGKINGNGAIRCVYLTNGAVLSGFTLTNGATELAGAYPPEDSGGGVRCVSTNAWISNCVFIGNSAGNFGGGAEGGTLINCTFAGNSAWYGGGVKSAMLIGCTLSNNGAAFNGGGAYASTLTNCTLVGNSEGATGNSSYGGGGAYQSTLSACAVIGNWAYRGGGTYTCSLTNCTLIGNYVTNQGGGAYQGSLVNCVLSNNFCYDQGGGVYGASLQNCLLVSNAAYRTCPTCFSTYGGGAYQGTLTRCTLLGNSASEGGGVCLGSLTNCALIGNTADFAGGGADTGGLPSGCTLVNCILTDNSAVTYGGGARQCTLLNCVLNGNSAGTGGGTYLGNLYNCTVVSNSASASAGGSYQGSLDNCINYYNIAPNGNSYSSSMAYCCTTPVFNSSSFTNAPIFVNLAGGDLHLQSNSPSINAGYNGFVVSATDLDGNPRISGGTVDVGAYEFQNPGSIISYAWLNHYGLPTDGSADFVDTDGDGMNNYQEWREGTDPTNPLSVLKLLSPSTTASNATVTWASVNTRNYYLMRSTNLGVPSSFSLVATNIPGLPGTTSYTDTGAPSPGPAFYRVGVQ
jgi:hypothetical protein